MELHERLTQADAPDGLIARVRAGALDVEQALVRCERAEHRAWILGVAGAPTERLVEAAGAALLWADERVGFDEKTVASTIDEALGGDDPVKLLELAEASEQIAESGAPTSYRQPVPPGGEAIARGAALLARAAEAQLAASAAREAGRLEEARARGATLGVGVDVALPADEGPLRLRLEAAAVDPSQGALHFVVAACAEVTREAEEALAAAGMPREKANAAIDAAFDDALRSE